MKYIFLRHGHSKSNEMRDRGEPGSQDVGDPGLSKKGVSETRAYRVSIHRLLKSYGLDLKTAVVASSPLRRAQETARFLFPGKVKTVLPFFGENGAIPENTPTGKRYQTPDLDKTLETVKRLGDTVIIVGHGSFLTSVVWPTMVGTTHNKFHNLDGFLLEGTSVTEIPYLSRMKYRKTKNAKKNSRLRTRRKKQRGGGLPWAFFRPEETSAYTHITNSRDVHSNDSWVRTPLNSM